MTDPRGDQGAQPSMPRAPQPARQSEPKGAGAMVSGAPNASSTLRTEFIKLEYDYLTKSSFHSDELRNKFIEFYLLLVSVAGTVILGLGKLQLGDNGAPALAVPMWVYSLVAVFIGALGVVMLPIFVRLRRVVLECLQGTVLLKQYVFRRVADGDDQLYDQAFLWDCSSLPQDERYLTASFLLILLIMVLSSAMFGLAAFVFLSESPGCANELTAAGLWSLPVWAGALTLQVCLYRLHLWHELRRARASDRFEKKWMALALSEDDKKKLAPPQLWPALAALGVGVLVTCLFWIVASQRVPYSSLF